MNTVEEIPSGTDNAPEFAPDVPAGQLVVQQAKAMNRGNEPDGDAVAGSDKSLEMVRNILFGEQVRETEKRQASLERYIRVSVGALNEETQKRIDGLKGEISLLTDLLEEEIQNRKADRQHHHERFEKAEQSLDKLGRQLLDNRSEINNRIGHEKHQLNQQMKDWRQDILQQLQAATTRLSQQKADRQTMAKLLTGMAEKLAADETTAS